MISSEHLAAIEIALAELNPGARLRQASRLEGGMSADLYLLELTSPDGEAFRRVARFPSAYVRTLFANAPRHEEKVLDWVSRAGLPAPRPFGSTDELLLMEWMPGVATARPADPASFLQQMATWLARIHQVPLTPEACETLPEASRKFVSTGEANIALREPEIRAEVAKEGGTPWPSTCLRHVFDMATFGPETCSGSRDNALPSSIGKTP
ncbi:MAG TPA: phosphotransferase [Fimbriimonadaceae bacterium]|nr:phosphotransferase [Fimbriimonadaceae bacterium]HRJ33411.1 phosphotransferase [Fimbriimonadaceae bacterium]